MERMIPSVAGPRAFCTQGRFSMTGHIIPSRAGHLESIFADLGFPILSWLG